MIFSFILFHVAKVFTNISSGIKDSKSMSVDENIGNAAIGLGKVIMHIILGVVGGIIFFVVVLFVDSRI